MAHQFYIHFIKYNFIFLLFVETDLIDFNIVFKGKRDLDELDNFVEHYIQILLWYHLEKFNYQLVPMLIYTFNIEINVDLTLSHQVKINFKII